MAAPIARRGDRRAAEVPQIWPPGVKPVPSQVENRTWAWEKQTRKWTGKAGKNNSRGKIWKNGLENHGKTAAMEKYGKT